MEDELFKFTGIDAEKRRTVGANAGAKVMSIDDVDGHWAHKAANFVTYAGVVLLIIGYTVYALVNSVNNGAGGWIALFAISYLALAVVLGCSWKVSILGEKGALADAPKVILQRPRA